MIRIITDSTSDITKEEAEVKNISIVPLRIMFGEESFFDGVNLGKDEFYEKLAVSEALPTTSQPSPEDFLAHFEDAKEKGDTVIAILLSSKLSGTYQSAVIAKGLAEYDDIFVIDSMTAIGGIRMLVNEAIRMRDNGDCAADIVARISDMSPRVSIIAMVDTLEYLYKGGRLSRAAKIAGSLLSFKPLITVDNGEIGLIGKARGLKKALQLVGDNVANGPEIDDSVPVYFGYTYTQSTCQTLHEVMAERFGMDSTHTSSIGATIGTHIGPGACAVIYLRK